MAPRELRRPEGPGFTLVELLVVIAIIGILASLTFTVAAAISRYTKRKSAAGDVARLAGAIEVYSARANFLPVPPGDDAATAPDGAYENAAVLAQLNGLMNVGPLFTPEARQLNAKGSFIDPWGVPYRVVFTRAAPSDKRPTQFAVWSCGPNRRWESGVGDDAGR